MESVEAEKLPLPHEQIAAFVPEALRTAITEYHAYCARPKKDDTPKSFEEHHKGAKAAVAHIEMIARVALKSGLPGSDPDPNRAAVTAALLREAMADIAAFEGNAGG